MSYDVSLNITGGTDATVGALWVNHTSNTSQMWREAGCDLAEFDDAKASDLAASLRPALADMATRMGHYKQWEPDNGWGSVESTMTFLAKILSGCDDFPDAIVRVSR